MACDADEIMSKFSEFSDILEHFTKDEKTNEQSDVGLFGFSEQDRQEMGAPDFKLLPEFGNFMIEAVPMDPYGSYANADELLLCEKKISNR